MHEIATRAWMLPICDGDTLDCGLFVFLRKDETPTRKPDDPTSEVRCDTWRSTHRSAYLLKAFVVPWPVMQPTTCCVMCSARGC